MMNQVRNLIQWKNLTQEQKDDFNFENYEYQFQSEYEWTNSIVIRGESAGYDLVYRLVIEDDEWYTVAASGIKDGRTFTTLGSQLEAYDLYRILLPAKPNEIPQPEKTLEQKIQDKWPEHGVVMLVPENGILRIVKNVGACEYDAPHIYAQSMKGFYKYVYVNEGGGLYIEREPTDYCENTGKTLQPVAGLFERSEG